MKPPAEWTMEDARAAIAAPLDRLGKGGLARRRDYVMHQDHWRRGEEWVGSVSDPALRARVLAAVAPQFVSVDTVGEGLDNATDGLFATEPALMLVPREPAEDGSAEAERQQEEAERLRGILSAWWDRVGLWQLAADAWRHGLWSTRGTLRLRIPRALMDGDDEPVLPTGLDLADALARLYLSAPDPEVAGVLTDPDTLTETAVLLYTVGTDELENRAELWIREPNADTITVRVLGGDTEQVYELRVPALPILEADVELLLTDPVLSQQRRQNYAETLLVRVVETAGFPERYLLDAEEPELWLPTPPADGRLVRTRVENGVTYYRYVAPIELGPAIVAFLAGITTGTEDDQHHASPSVVFRDPTDPEYITKVCEYARSVTLRSMKQGHLAYSGQVQLSGVAYQQARAVFEQFLRRRKGDVEGLIRDTIAAAILWAEAMGSGTVSIMDDYRVVVNLTVHAGPVLPDQQQATTALYEAGLRSRPTALAETGVEDGDAEAQMLDAEPRQREQDLKMLVDIVAVLARETSLAATVRALEAAGFEPEVARALLPRDMDGVALVAGG